MFVVPFLCGEWRDQLVASNDQYIAEVSITNSSTLVSDVAPMFKDEIVMPEIDMSIDAMASLELKLPATEDLSGSEVRISAEELPKFMDFDAARQTLFVHKNQITQAGSFVIRLVLSNAKGSERKYETQITVVKPASKSGVNVPVF